MANDFTAGAHYKDKRPLTSHLPIQAKFLAIFTLGVGPAVGWHCTGAPATSNYEHTQPQSTALTLAAMDLIKRTAKLVSDTLFGPVSPDIFDLTLKFEQSILSILPACLVILATPIYLRRFFKKSAPCTAHSPHLWLKVLLSMLLVVIEVGHLFVCVLTPALHSSTSLAASLLSCAGSVSVAIILYTEHRYSVQPSTFLSVYLSISTIFHFTKARSYFLRNSLDAAGALSVLSASLNVSLVILEEIPKGRRIANQRMRRFGKETLGGFWNRALFIWLNSLLTLGFKSILTMDDLESIGDDFNSEAAYEMFKPKWDRVDKKSNNALLRACMQTWGWEYAGAIIPRICYSALVLCQPLLFRRVIDYVKEQGQDKPQDYAAFIIGASLLLYLCIAITKSCARRLSFRVIMFIRGALITAICKKMLTLSAAELHKSAALTLLDNDIEQIKLSIRHLHNSWASLIEVVVGLYILSTVIGPAAFFVLIPTFLSACVTRWVQKRSGRARTAWNEGVEARVGATSKVLPQLKNVKTSGLSVPVSKRLQCLRNDEIKASLQERVLQTISFTSESFNNALSPAIAIAGALYWTRRADGGPTVSDVFVTLAVIVTVSFPLSRTMVEVPEWSRAYSCILRVQNFLTLDELSGISPPDEDDRTELPDKNPRKRLYRVQEKAKMSTNPIAVELVNITVHHVDKNSTVLRDANLQFKSGDVTSIVGPVGCGKSALLQTILGEVAHHQGSVILDRSLDTIAFCHQIPWIQNISIRNIIIGQGRFDCQWYNTVVAACALEEDIGKMENGHETIAGIAGCNFSGGQRQRLALARAVYVQPSLIVIDDIFSALDTPTATFILSTLFGSAGILRRAGSTVILATSCISHLTVADSVFAMNGEGDVQPIPKKIAMLGSGSTLLRAIPKQPTTQQNDASPTTSTATSSNAATPSNTTSDAEPIGTVPVNVERQRGDFSLYLYYFKETGWKFFTFWLFTGIFTAFADSMPQLFVRIWMSNAPKDNIYYIGYVLLSATAALSIGGCLWLYYYKVAPRAQNRLHWNLLQAVMKAPLSYMKERDSGSILTRFTQDIGYLTNELPRNFMEVSLLSFMILFEIIIIASGTKYATVLIPFCFLCLYFMQYYYLRTARQIRYLDAEARIPLYTHFSEIENGIQHIRAFHWQEPMLHEMVSMLDRSQRPHYHQFCLTTWLSLVLDLFLMGIANVLITLAVCFPTTTSQAAIGLSLVNLLYFTDNIHSAMSASAGLETAIGSLHRTRQFIMDTPSEPTVDRLPAEIPDGWPRCGRVDFSSVTAAYSAKTVLDGVSFKIPAGYKVGIVGRTGSGKTSTILAILNMLNFSGSICIDEIPVESVPLNFLRSRIITIAQGGVELEGTVRENIDPYREEPGLPSDESITEVLRRVGLAEYVERHGGLDESVSSLGLSHGQKQLMCIARAVLRKESTSAKVVLVDEATSSIDDETGERIHNVMAEAFADCTVITVAHRLQALNGTDLVFNMEDGKITKVLEKDSDEWRTWEEYTSTAKEETMDQDEQACT